MANDMQDLAGRAEVLIGSITGALMAAAEAAAERVELAAEVARIRQKMAAFADVLASVGSQKEVLAARLANASGPMQALLQAQIEALTALEMRVLSQAGVQPATASKALEITDETLYKRDGRRYVAVGTNGSNGGGQ